MAKTEKNIVALTVTAKIDRFRRAGIEFGKEPVTVSLEALTEDQLKALRDEPMLIVEEVSA